MNKIINIIAQWDAKEKIWYATSDDVVGLHVCCHTLDEVIEVIDDVLPDLVAKNLDDEEILHKNHAFIPYHLLHKHIVKANH